MAKFCPRAFPKKSSRTSCKKQMVVLLLDSDQKTIIHAYFDKNSLFLKMSTCNNTQPSLEWCIYQGNLQS